MAPARTSSGWLHPRANRCLGEIIGASVDLAGDAGHPLHLSSYCVCIVLREQPCVSRLIHTHIPNSCVQLHTQADTMIGARRRTSCKKTMLSTHAWLVRDRVMTCTDYKLRSCNFC